MKKLAFILDGDLPNYEEKIFCTRISSCGFQRQDPDGIVCTLAGQDFGDEIDKDNNVCVFTSYDKPSVADLK